MRNEIISYPLFHKVVMEDKINERNLKYNVTKREEANWNDVNIPF